MVSSTYLKHTWPRQRTYPPLQPPSPTPPRPATAPRSSEEAVSLGWLPLVLVECKVPRTTLHVVHLLTMHVLTPCWTPLWQATNKLASGFEQVEEYADTIRQAVVCITGRLPSVCCPALLVMNFRLYAVAVEAPRVEISVALQKVDA